jgi:hypothetical protein
LLYQAIKIIKIGTHRINLLSKVFPHQICPI